MAWGVVFCNYFRTIRGFVKAVLKFTSLCFLLNYIKQTWKRFTVIMRLSRYYKIIMKKNIYNRYHIPMFKIWNGYKKQQMKNSRFHFNPSMLPKFVIKNIVKIFIICHLSLQISQLFCCKKRYKNVMFDLNIKFS